MRQAARWAIRLQLPALARSLVRRPGAMPLDLVVAELRGCLKGPWAWLASNRRHRVAS
jgi:hypothetical protein